MQDGGTDAPRGRRLVDRLLGGAADPGPERPARVREQAPPAVRRAALVVVVEAVALAAVAAWLLWLTVTSDPESVAGSIGGVVLVAFFAGVTGAAAVGLWRVSGWARGPVVVLQIMLALFGYTSAFSEGQPLIGVPLLVLAAVELYLLLTPEARLAFFDR